MASAVILGLAGAVAVVLVLGSETGEGSGESGPAAFASMAETHEPSIVTLRRLPAEAAVTLDGRAHSGSAIEVPRDGAEHVIEVNAPGFEPWQVTHSGDADVAYDVVLRPLGAGGAATRPGRGAESGTRGTARPRGTGRPDELIRDPGF
jgi:hypothetical protein